MASIRKAAKRFPLSIQSLVAAVLLAALPAWTQTPDTPAQVPSTSAQTPNAPPKGSEEVTRSEKIVVTGSTIRGVSETGSNLISVSRENIRLIGAPTTPELLSTVPQLNSFNTAPRAANGGFGSFAPGLRNLPSSATLLLMNGHRLVGASTQETNPDYPNIPTLAIQRVEIVADGASAIYGSDAIAGVVNFITRKPFSGVEADVRYGTGDDYHSFYASGLFGQDWATGSVMAAYQYTDNGNITGGDRSYRVQDFRPYGGVDTRSVNCPLANVRVPPTFTTNYAAPNFAPNTTNYCDNGATADLLPMSRIHSLFVTAQQDLGTNATLWADLLYSDRNDDIRVAPPAQTSTILNTNPYFTAPPGTGATAEAVLFRLDNIFGSDHLTQTDRARVGNSSAGVDIDLSGGMNLSVYGTADWATNDAFQPGVDAVALAVAAAGTTAATALDPFGTRTSPAVAAAITNSPTRVTVKQRTYLGAAKIDGPLVELPGGKLKIAAGAEYRRETFTQEGFVGATPVPESLDRNIYSAFGEVFVPVFGARNEAPGIHRLSLSLSTRYDHYSDFGSTTNPKYGITWDPVDGFTVRGTYGHSFRAPGVRQLGATVGSVYLPASFAAVLAPDPTRGAAQVNTIYLIGGNPGLEPETARTYSLGVDFRPRSLPDFRASATFYDIEFTEAIGTPSASLVFTDPVFASSITRNPTTAQLNAFLANAVPINLPNPLPTIGNLLDLRLDNFGIRNTNGLDIDVAYRSPMSFGAVFAGFAANRVLKFDTRPSPGSAVSNSLRFGVPRTTSRTTVGAQAGSFTVVSFVNYRSGITNTFTTPTGTSEFTTSSYTTVDLRVAYALPVAAWTKGAELALQVNDLLDRKPPFFPGTDGIGGTYNPIGRFVALNLRGAF